MVSFFCVQFRSLIPPFERCIIVKLIELVKKSNTWTVKKIKSIFIF